MLRPVLHIKLCYLLLIAAMGLPKAMSTYIKKFGRSDQTPYNSWQPSQPWQPSQSAERFVFAHFIVGIVSNRDSAADYDADMQQAKAHGIDAFALNIGTDSYTDQQLEYAYSSAASNGMKVFISFDFNWYSAGQVSNIASTVQKYANSPAQLVVDGKPFVSTFVGDTLNVASLRDAIGRPIYLAPNFDPAKGADFSKLDAAFNWIAWPNDGNNRAPSQSSDVTVQSGDQRYVSALQGKDYMAPVSPWFFTHFGPEVSYSKNWMFPSDTLWYDRWQEILTMKPRFVEIVTWNDYGESHYVGPLSGKHTDDGAGKWTDGMPHDGWLEMAKPFVEAYKAGVDSVENFVNEDKLIYWYRPQLKSTNCDATDNCMSGTPGGNYFIGRPNGFEQAADEVFVVSLLKNDGKVTISSGGQSQIFQAKKGANMFKMPMQVGQQKFSLSTSDGQICATSAKEIIGGCSDGIYNFNAYVGSVNSTNSSCS